MKSVQSNFYLLKLSMIILLVAIKPAAAETIKNQSNLGVTAEIEQSRDRVSISAKDLEIKQDRPRNSKIKGPEDFANQDANLIAQGVTRVTGVEVNQTESGLELVLKTVAGSERLVPLILPEGNDLVIEILDATLGFSIRNGVTELNPAPGISRVTVNNAESNSIRVRIAGANQTPSAEVVSGRDNLVLSITPDRATAESESDESIDVIVTGQAEENTYNPQNSSTATRTNTPLRDLPASVQVIPQKVIKDQGVTELREAVRNNAPGVALSENYGGFGGGSFILRGFAQSFAVGTTFRDGFRDFDQFAITDLANIEQIDILRGPASILFGQVQPGGIINIVTEKPLSEPTYTVEFTAGQFSFYRPEIDFSGPLTEDGDLLYRLNIAYQNSGSFRDLVDSERFFIAPVLQWDISENTSLTLDFSYLYNDPVFDNGLLPLSDGSLVLPIERNLDYPLLDDTSTTQLRARYRLNHRFNDNLKLRNAFSFSSDLLTTGRTTGLELIDDRFVQSTFRGDEEYRRENYQLQTDLIGTFSTGSIDHELTVGVDLYRYNIDGFERNSSDIPLLDAFDPDYDVDRPNLDLEPAVQYGTRLDSLGIYIQDQIDITDNIHLLLGGRLNFTEQEDFTVGAERTEQSDSAFSPNAGIVYQPIEPISLYASYARSFNPSIGRSQDGSTFEPERGTQYEIGVKTEISEKLSATLALFDITKSNVLNTDPDNFGFFIQTGEEGSQGIELSTTGEILPGWNIYAGYAYTDAKITKDNDIQGDSLFGVAEHTANLWTTYEIQSGDVQGLGFGFGLLFVGEREGDLPNSNFELPSYVRADTSIFYRRENWRTAININNLFDTEYYESAVFPGAPFNVRGTLSYTF